MEIGEIPRDNKEVEKEREKDEKGKKKRVVYREGVKELERDKKRYRKKKMSLR